MPSSKKRASGYDPQEQYNNESNEKEEETLVFLWRVFFVHPPKGGRGCLMSPSSRISGLSFDSTFLSLLLFLCLIQLSFLSCIFSANGPFSDFFSSRNFFNSFTLRNIFFVILFCFLVWLLISS